MASLSRIRVFPIKAHDGIELDAVSIADGGRLEHDREYAMFDADGDYVNGRKTPRVHELESTFDLEAGTVELAERGGDRSGRFALDADTEEIDTWLTDFFDEPVNLERARSTNFNDSAGGLSPMKIDAPGPTVVSESGLEEIASWFDDLGVDDVRRRFRVNLEIDGVEPFWEDRLFSDVEHAVEFRIGDVTLHGVMGKPRCVTPTRDPETGEAYSGFVSTYTDNRERTFPEWADTELYGQHIEIEVQHYYYMSVVTRIPRTEVGKTLRVGDGVEVGDELSVIRTL